MKKCGWRMACGMSARRSSSSVLACQRARLMGDCASAPRTLSLTSSLTPLRRATWIRFPCSSTCRGDASLSRKTRSAPFSAASIDLRSRRSPRKGSSPCSWGSFSGLREKARTFCPRPASRRSSSLPIVPVAPVTRIMGLPCSWERKSGVGSWELQIAALFQVRTSNFESDVRPRLKTVARPDAAAASWRRGCGRPASRRTALRRPSAAARPDRGSPVRRWPRPG